MKKDIGQDLVCIIGRALTVLANQMFIIRTSVHSSIISKDYSINNLVVDYAENESIGEFQPYHSKFALHSNIKLPSASEPYPLYFYQSSIGTKILPI